jgi:hypothetical protein
MMSSWLSLMVLLLIVMALDPGIIHTGDTAA